MSTPPPTIDQLQQLPLPAPASYLPQTWGWAVLLAVVVLAVAAFAWRARRRWRRNQYRRQALAELAVLELRMATDRQAARALPALLKRVALSAPGGGDAAALRGAAWQTYLTRQGGTGFPVDAERTLATLAYGSPQSVAAIPAATLSELLAACRHWTEGHHVAA
jgi:hypothetical protein